MEKLIILGVPEDKTPVSGKPAFDKIKEVIEYYRPVFVLSERMENQSVEREWTFKKILKKKKFSNMTSVEEVKELIKLCNKNKIKLIGIDFQNFLLDLKQQTAVKKHRKVSEEEEKEFEDIALRRENKHVKMIEKYLAISRKPVVVIVGAWHLRENSQIRKEFEGFDEGCKLIYPVNAAGNQVLGPTKKKVMWNEERI
jgi:hypothetical protein